MVELLADGIKQSLEDNAEGEWVPISFRASVDLAKQAAAPISVAAFLGVSALFVLGVSLIWRLIELSWSGSPDESIRAASAALTAIAAIFGAIFLCWRTVVAHWSARASQHQAAIARETHLTTLFTKAVEFLGATREVKRHETALSVTGSTSQLSSVPNSVTEPNVEVRLGAIYALERIAKDSERDHWPIMEVLCAYIRNPQNSGVPALPEPGKVHITEWRKSIRPPRIDVQAALTVIGRRSPERIQYEVANRLRLNFEGANLQDAILSHGDFSRAIFKRAALDLARIDFAKLETANFWGASMDSATFQHCGLRDACFASSKLSHASIIHSSAQNCLFHKAYLYEATFFQSSLDGARLFGTNLSQASIQYDQLIGTLGDITTRLPDGMQRPDTWLERAITDEESREYIVVS
jgi:Pentapeptide repeats (8 copies)